MNHYEASGNIALALRAIENDGVKLVNIGKFKARTSYFWQVDADSFGYLLA